MGSRSPLYVAITADIDPDANRAIEGRPGAVSAGAGEGARLFGAVEGLRRMADLLLEENWPATLFWEGRTLEGVAEREPDLLDRLRDAPALEHGCHGMYHEDFAGETSGVPLDRDATRNALREAVRTCRQHLGGEPELFRAPYCRLTEPLIDVLWEMEFRCDASRTAVGPGRDILSPYPLRQAEGRTLWEAPLCRWEDRWGRPMDAYLWPLLEGKRSADDYRQLVDSVASACPGGLLQVALHPWHLCAGQD
ncbi:MAG: polysaccharide deacetylase family protein, partial [Planctomycetota bacterium]